MLEFRSTPRSPGSGAAASPLLSRRRSGLLIAARSLHTSARSSDSSPASGGSAAREPVPGFEDEAAWRGLGEHGEEHQPAPHDVLHHSCDLSAEHVFEHGLPAPGGNFSLRSHAFRSGDRSGTDDAFYGTAVYAARPADGGGYEGPLAHHGNSMLIMRGAYGVGVGAQQQHGVSLEEHEVAVHKVPPHKITVHLDKRTGTVTPNPNLPPEETREDADRARRLHEFGTHRGLFE